MLVNGVAPPYFTVGKHLIVDQQIGEPGKAVIGANRKSICRACLTFRCPPRCDLQIGVLIPSSNINAILLIYLYNLDLSEARKPYRLPPARRRDSGCRRSNVMEATPNIGPTARTAKAYFQSTRSMMIGIP